MNFESAYNIVDKIPGWMGDIDSKVLWKYASKVSGLIVEIGPYKGRSTKMMALASPNSRIISIESFDKGDTKEEFLRNTVDHNVVIMVGKSQNVGKNWKEQIDLLHIDGDHRFGAVKRDIELFAPHVKNGGHILLHDYVVYADPERIIQRRKIDANDRSFYNDSKYGVVKAVDECRNLLGSIHTEGGFAVCKK